MAEETEGKAAGGGGKGAFIIAVVLLAVVGAVAGAGFSLMFLNAGAPAHDAQTGKRDLQIVQGSVKHGDAGAAPKSANEPSKVLISNLDPILVTLSGPQRSWARLELGVILDAPAAADDGVLLKSMTEDIMSYMRTVPLTHVESATGVEYLREDIEEIARLRSKGRARSVVLRSLVVE
jgi:flagellar FliL protein